MDLENLKERIASYGKKDRDSNNLKTCSSQSAHTVILIFQFNLPIKKSILANRGFSGALLQTSNTECDVDVRPPQEFRRKRFIVFY